MTTEPRLSVCQFTTPDTTFEEDLELVAEAGATGLSICEFKLTGGDEDRQREALEASGLQAAVCMPSNISPLPSSRAFPGPTDLAERVELMCRSVRRLAPFRPATIVLLTGSGEGMTAREARRAAVEGLREVAAVAGEAGTRVSLEPQRVDLVPGRSLVTTIPEALELVDEVGEPTLDVMYDVYHLWDTPGRARLDRAPRTRVRGRADLRLARRDERLHGPCLAGRRIDRSSGPLPGSR